MTDSLGQTLTDSWTDRLIHPLVTG